MTQEELQTRLVEIDRFERVEEYEILNKVEPFVKLGYSFKAEPNSYHHVTPMRSGIKTDYTVTIYRKEYVNNDEVDADE